jgi:Cutinase
MVRTMRAMLAVTLVVAAAVVPLAVGASSASAGEGCGHSPAVNFVGVRGSGETWYDGVNDGTSTVESYAGLGIPGMGKPINGLLSDIQTDQPNLLNNYLIPLDYPAIKVNGFDPMYYISDYDASVSDGFAKLRSLVISSGTACPNWSWVLAGYSQGAQVVGDVFDSLDPRIDPSIDPKLQSRVYVVMFGDPRFNHAQKQKVNQPTSGQYAFGPSDGVYARTHPARTVPGGAANNVRSWCTGGDPVCNSTAANTAYCVAWPDLCPHIEYITRGLVRQAADWVESLSRTLGR